jgi:ribosomal small subunit protein bTHX
MGKGDKKTKKGKISMGSHGNSRPRNAAKAVAASGEKSTC